MFTSVSISSLVLCVRESGIKTLKHIQRKGEEREGSGGGGRGGERDSK